MEVKFDIPDDVATALATGGRDLSRVALEALAIEGYRTETLSEWQIAQMLGFEVRMQVHQFLKDHKVYMNLTYEEVMEDYAVAKRVADEVTKRREEKFPERLAG